jgi:hypothetical protein
MGTKVTGKDVSIAPISVDNSSGMIQEHIDLIRSIRGKGEPLNASKEVADATMCAIGARISAYTGQLVRWVDLTENTKSPHYDLTLGPAALDFETGDVLMPNESPEVPGKEKQWRERGAPQQKKQV